MCALHTAGVVADNATATPQNFSGLVGRGVGCGTDK